MKRVLTSAALCVMLALGLAAPAALASDNNGGGKAVVQMTPRAEAIKKCNDDYRAAVKKANGDYAEAVKDAKGKKGKEHTGSEEGEG